MKEERESRQFESRHGETYPANTNAPVTVLAKHKVYPGSEDKFEDWIKDVTRLQEDFDEYIPGIQGNLSHGQRK